MKKIATTIIFTLSILGVTSASLSAMTIAPYYCYSSYGCAGNYTYQEPSYYYTSGCYTYYYNGYTRTTSVINYNCYTDNTYYYNTTSYYPYTSSQNQYQLYHYSNETNSWSPYNRSLWSNTYKGGYCYYVNGYYTCR